MDERLLALVCDAGRSGDKAALVTIVSTRGSTPRKAGSKMLIYADGRSYGTIGGGCGEAEVRMQALHAMDEGKPRMYTVSMLNDVAAQEGMVCGGIMEVFIQIV